MDIHPTAIVEPGAEVDPSARIGPYSLIEAGARIAADCVIESGARIYAPTRLGVGNWVGHGVTLGVAPQDTGFRAERSRPLWIGARNRFREYVNISRGDKDEAGTRIGDDNYFMAFAHVGHDCQVGDGNVFANAATLGGHVVVGSRNFVSSQVAVHQFCRIGDLCMIGGVSGVTQDVPPFLIANGQRARLIGINRVGLRRHGFTAERRARIQAIYRLLLRSGLPLATALEQVAARYPEDPDAADILAFVRGGRGRGLVAFRRSAHEVQNDP